MKTYIAHRGNRDGPLPSRENHPEYIQEALREGFECECDVWFVNDSWWLGHDEPQYTITETFFNTKGLWLHAKNYEALVRLLALGPSVHVFFHDTDAYTITSQGVIWAYPGQPIGSERTVCVMPERTPSPGWEKACAICSDWVRNLRRSEGTPSPHIFLQF